MKASFNSLGKVFQVEFSIGDIDANQQSAIFNELLRASGVLDVLQTNEDLLYRVDLAWDTYIKKVREEQYFKRFPNEK